MSTACTARSAECRRPEAPQLFVAERLHPEAQTIDASGAKSFEPCRESTVSGLASSVISASGGQPERMAALIDDGRDFRRLEQGWRAAAEVQGVRGKGEG